MENEAKVNSGRLGAANELAVCSELLRRGYEVFRAVSQSASCDLLVITPDGEVQRVEVRSGYERLDGSWSTLVQHKDKCDIYAVVVNGVIRYLTVDEALNSSTRKRRVSPQDITY